ncbi:Mitochondrial carrier protein [Penicillium maclennaniae]|uniref:Mitochondrial carrier protein n=1 Tax=Penicillium maclennaniae TaxID=1343394 RepID=UPI0025405BBC|nr:Mitochondrial carrier protein [Penicillium maclennaniae]KAJ5665670.1 Mitochondrial carrier protein [Penicillium maclennaniae]
MPSSNTWTMDESTRNKLLKKYQTQVASGSSTICATLAVTPLENVKTRMQTHDFRSIPEVVRYIWRNEGPRGFVAGCLPPLVSVTAVRVMNFTAYNWTKDKLDCMFKKFTGVSPLEEYNKPGSTPTISGLSMFITAGLAAGLVSSPLACPFELAKNVVQTSVLMQNRAQAAPDAVRNPSLRNEPRLSTVQAIRQIVARHGFRGLYTGFGLHALRDSIGTGLYFSIYETIKQVVVRQLGESQSPFGPPAVAGAICSTLPWFCTYPLDTRKTRAQSVLLGKAQEIASASKAVAGSSMYKGLSIVVLRTGINNMILLSIYEYIKYQINNLP